LIIKNSANLNISEMGTQNSTNNDGAEILDDELELDQYVPIELKDAFLSLAQRQTNGDLRVRASDIK